MSDQDLIKVALSEINNRLLNIENNILHLVSLEEKVTANTKSIDALQELVTIHENKLAQLNEQQLKQKGSFTVVSTILKYVLGIIATVLATVIVLSLQGSI